jgi:hypothetical protein
MALNLRLPPDLDLRARKESDRLHISLNSLICVAVDRYLANPEASPLPWGFRPYTSAPTRSVVPVPLPVVPEPPKPVPVPVQTAPARVLSPPGAHATKAERKAYTAQMRLARKA